ncbi:hypothetical protein A3Q56_06112 [Intoshia linei]|uniref:Uncharacterized protein n=1 Tax=Intoshia linei TaxID=1819745 RepID=A0A177AXN1_9BILA|nr:hypothetical protein A3Q56_06112 [Intoshia linei]
MLDLLSVSQFMRSSYMVGIKCRQRPQKDVKVNKNVFKTHKKVVGPTKFPMSHQKCRHSPRLGNTDIDVAKDYKYRIDVSAETDIMKLTKCELTIYICQGAIPLRPL